MRNKELWVDLLEGFNQRNVGRRARLEFHDPMIGAQGHAPDAPLLGVAYDPRDDQVEIMFGQLGTPDEHLTHCIRAARELDVLGGPGEREEILRIGHREGQTLLRLG